MSKTSRKNKKSKKNVKHYSRKNKINKMRGGEILDGLKLKKISQNDPSLTVLDFSDSDIDDNQLELLAVAIKNNNVVTSIKFKKISNKTAEQLIIALFGNTSLTNFDISDKTDITDPEIMSDLEFITKRNKYYLQYKQENPDMKSNSKTLADFVNKFNTHLTKEDLYKNNPTMLETLKTMNFGLKSVNNKK